MQQTTVVVRLLKTYRFREAESSIINRPIERNSKHLRVSIAFTTDTRLLRLLARAVCMQSDYGNVTNCYKGYRLTMLSDYLINLVG